MWRLEENMLVPWETLCRWRPDGSLRRERNSILREIFLCGGVNELESGDWLGTNGVCYNHKSNMFCLLFFSDICCFKSLIAISFEANIVILVVNMFYNYKKHSKITSWTVWMKNWAIKGANYHWRVTGHLICPIYIPIKRKTEKIWLLVGFMKKNVIQKLILKKVIQLLRNHRFSSWSRFFRMGMKFQAVPFATQRKL